MSNILWDDQVPDDTSSFIPIFGARANGVQLLVLLAGKMFGVWTHYVDRRTIPCTAGSDKECVCQRKQIGRRWKGYLPAWEPRFSRKVLLEMTAEGVRTSELPHIPEAELRGRTVKLRRRGDKPNSPVVVEILPTSILVVDLPEPFDVKAALIRVWADQASH